MFFKLNKYRLKHLNFQSIRTSIKSNKSFFFSEAKEKIAYFKKKKNSQFICNFSEILLRKIFPKQQIYKYRNSIAKFN